MYKKTAFFLFITIIFFCYQNIILAQDDDIKQYFKGIYLKSHPQDPKLPPNFFIKSKSESFQMGFGGYVRLYGIYDLNGLQTVTDFITYEIPVGQGNTRQNRFALDVRQSRFYTEILGMTKYGTLRIYMEADFLGETGFFRLRHAFGQFKGFLAGKTWSTFMDLSASPNTVDFEGPNSEICHRAVMIRFTQALGDHFIYSVAIEQPDVSITNENTEDIPQYVPDIIARVKTYGKLGHLQLAGLFRDIAYEDTITAEKRSSRGWGVAFSGSLNITKKNKFMFQTVYGDGISKYIQDISGTGRDLVPKPGCPGELQALPVLGLYAALQHNWTQKLNSTIVYGYTEAYDLGNKPPDNYQTGMYVAANLFWDLLPTIRFGIEYLWGERVNKNGDSGTANRIDFMAKYSF
jgi:hypothetical protein